SLALAYPLTAAPAAGDAFTVYQGCDHRLATCQTQFANQANFRGFPFIPPPTLAIQQ
ncbi:phage BR0599 family protein, partial [Jatrophihabitans endophyticus]|uniref:phage BR0599 family protein n=1 Tax=Jatrophihabitans endophyticus TaxID=1206085 RepID=UPI0019E9A337|nr:phage BR0599 family protein [Jatrophihabitans endophyticus]